MQDTHPPSEAIETSPESEHRFPCDRCGSDLRFSPGEGKLVCDHCGYARPIDDQGDRADAITELDLRAGLDAALSQAETLEIRTVSCPNCGAVIQFDDKTHASDCPFCATPVVIDTGTRRVIKPRALLPFALEEREARKAMTDWLGRLWFAPNGLQEYARKGRKLSGIYVPYWTFDAQTRSHYSGERGTVHYEGSSKERRMRVRWSPVSGRVARFFDDVLVLASRSLPKRFTDALEPWDLSALEPYQPQYLAGFRAEGYQIELDEAYGVAREHMERVIRRDVRFDIGGDQQRIHHIETDVSGVTFKHLLLPVWTAAYKFRGESYRFVINGRTGRVQGQRPWSVWKIAIAVILGLLIAGLAGYLYALSETGSL